MATIPELVDLYRKFTVGLWDATGEPQRHATGVLVKVGSAGLVLGAAHSFYEGRALDRLDIESIGGFFGVNGKAITTKDRDSIDAAIICLDSLVIDQLQAAGRRFLPVE